MVQENPKGKSNRGGPRRNSGRKTTEVAMLRRELVAESEKLIGDRLPKLIGNMIYLAEGGYERVEEKYEPGPDGEMVLIERKASVAEPDRMANQYLIDRILGKPTERHELSGPDGGPIPFDRMIAKVYGEPTGGDEPC